MTETSDNEEQLMEQYGITRVTKTVYLYKDYSYDNLKDTLRYVEIDTGRDQKEKPPDRNWK